MKTKKYFLLVISFLLFVSLFYSSTNSISSISDTMINKKNDDKQKEQLDADLEQETSSTPKLSQTVAWDDNGTVICNEDTGAQDDPQICYDGAGGAIITWMDVRGGNKDIYTQKIDSAGETKWADNGTVICNEKTNHQDNPEICSDGAGGAIITWEDQRSGNCDIYAQRINKTGDTQWGDNGTVICNYTATQDDPQICYDGNGGAIITWYDWRNGLNDLYAQKIDSAGKTQWKLNGTVISNAKNTQSEQQICSDGAGGAIITWEDQRSGNCDIYAQKIDSAGNTQWGETFWSGPGDRNGTVICNATNWQHLPQICNITGGAIITWMDERSGIATPRDIYAQRIDSAGDTQWTSNGTVICNDTKNQYEAQICCDGADGAIITWRETKLGNWDIFAQKVNSTGDAQWGDGTMWGGFQDRNGTVICNEINNNQYNPQICCDGAGDAIITWEDERNGASDVYAQKIDSAGNTQWGDPSWSGPSDRNGTVICNADAGQDDPQICYDGNGGAIITWADWRNGLNDVYAQKITEVSGGAGLGLPSADDDDDDDDDDDTGVVVVIIIVVVLACIGLGVVVMILIKKSKLKRG